MKKVNVDKEVVKNFGNDCHAKKPFKYLTCIDHFDTLEKCANVLGNVDNLVRGEIALSRTGSGFDVTWIESVCKE